MSGKSPAPRVTHAPYGGVPASSGGTCCAKCKTPYGHSAVAGICCHADETKDK